MDKCRIGRIRHQSLSIGIKFKMNWLFRLKQLTQNSVISFNLINKAHCQHKTITSQYNTRDVFTIDMYVDAYRKVKQQMDK